MRRLVLALTAVLLVACNGATATSPAASPAVAGDALLDAFVAAMNAEPLVTHLEQEATAHSVQGSTTADVRATLSGDVSGRDIAFRIQTSSGSANVDQELVVLGTSAWVRRSGGEWHVGPSMAALASVDNLVQATRLVTDSSQLRYAGAGPMDGRTLHHVVAATTIPYRASTGAMGRYDSFDAWVEEDGTPVLVEATFSVEQGDTKVTGSSKLRYSNFGGPLEIKPPEGAPSPLP